MKKIIKHGSLYEDNREITCEKCKCVFSYGNEDVQHLFSPISNTYFHYVTCPECWEAKYIAE